MKVSPTNLPVWLARLLCLVVLLAGPLHAAAPEKEEDEEALKAKYKKAINALPWIHGPAVKTLGERAELKFSDAYRFLEAKAAKKRLVMSGNEVDDREILGMVEHIADNWWVVFEFDAIGYVKDDEKNKLDPDKILQAYRDGISARNKRRDGPPTKVFGWHTKPNYNEETHNLEWALIFENSGSQYVNYKVKLLGRHGVVDGTWVGDLKDLDTAVPQFRQVLNDFKYKGGENYAEYRSGDKIAKYGLAALVTGGAVLGAAKLGLFTSLFVFLKKGIKLVVVAVVGLCAWIKKLVTGRRRESAE